MARRALRSARVTSLDGPCGTSRAQLAHRGDHAPSLRRLIAQGRPGVLAVLFDPPDWHVAMLLTHPESACW